MPRDKAKTQAENAKMHLKYQAIFDSEKTAPCSDCGGCFPPECMDWDHRPGEVKLRPVAKFKILAQRRAEQAKCDLVCANCHRIRTRKRGAGRPREYHEYTPTDTEEA